MFCGYKGLITWKNFRPAIKGSLSYRFCPRETSYVRFGVSRAVPRLLQVGRGGGGGGWVRRQKFPNGRQKSEYFPTCTQENQVFFILFFITLIVTLRTLIIRGVGMFLILGGGGGGGECREAPPWLARSEKNF